MSATNYFGRRHRRGDDATTQQAAEWLLRQQDGRAAGDDAEFQRWLSTHPKNRQAYGVVQETWTALIEPRESGQAARLECELHRLEEIRGRRRRAWLASGTAIAAAAAIMFGLFASPARRTVGPAVTVAVRPDQQTLPDGSVIELKAGAEIVLSYSPEKRGVRLLHGEALFSVAHDPGRPFVVSAGAVEVRAVGTAFTVSRGADKVAVLVTEGLVAVERMPVGADPIEAVSRPKPTYLKSGDGVVIPSDLPTTAPLAVTAKSAQQVAAGLAWRGKRVEFTDTPVAEAVALLNRENRLQLTIADPAVAQLQISGIFWVDDPDGFVRLLETGMNVRAERTADRIALRCR